MAAMIAVGHAVTELAITLFRLPTLATGSGFRLTADPIALARHNPDAVSSLRTG